MSQSYEQWLRTFVGSRKILVVFAKACIRDGFGNILCKYDGKFDWWDLPGGVLELNESLPDCVSRTVSKEIGLVVKPNQVIGVYSSPDFDISYPNGDELQPVVVCFNCHLFGNDMPISFPGSDLTWFPIDAIPSTPPWLSEAVTDLNLNNVSAIFRRGSPGNRIVRESYGSVIRSFLGKSAYIMPAANALIRDSENRMLFIRRSDNKKWAFPGGAMELGERIDQTIVNEVQEETGLIVTPKRLIAIYSDMSYWLTYPNGNEAKTVTFFFECQLDGGSPRADQQETLQVDFFSSENLPDVWDRDLRRLSDALADQNGVIFK